MAEQEPPAETGPKHMVEKLAQLDVDLHTLLDASEPMQEECAVPDARTPDDLLRQAHRLRPASGPPPGWQIGEPIEGFVPPTPQPEVMRAGALGACGHDASLRRAR